MAINLSFKCTKTTFRYILSLGIMGLIYIFAMSYSQAQVDISCETTAIYQEGHGWVEGSDQTTCTTTGTGFDDGSGLIDDGENSCGFGNPCPQAPIDRDEGLTEGHKCHLEQTVEKDIDQLANEIALGVTSLNTPILNPDNVEFGAFVLRLNDGQYVISPLDKGLTGQISLRRMLNFAQGRFSGTDASNIVAIVHLHPRESGPGFENVAGINELSPLDYGNTLPSHPNIAAGPNDWDNGRNFLLANGRSDVADVSHYILGPDGVLRQYNYSDGHPAESTEQHSLINEAESNAAGECNEENN